MALHIPVLEKEVLSAFSHVKIDHFVDGTLGLGGHAKTILSVHPEIKGYFGIDKDPKALELAAQNLKEWEEKIRFCHGSFTEFERFASDQPIDGMLFDLGVSSMQLDFAERGFSFSKEGPLDMRMNPEQELDARTVVNEWSYGDLARIFRKWGEEPRWKMAARAICHAREDKPIETTQELVSVLRGVVRDKRIHPMTRVFQALRIAVNQELEDLAEVLPKAIEKLKSPGGRLAVISFHSLEDRIVKQAFQGAASDKVNTEGIGGIFLDKEPTVKLITRKPIIATEAEVALNPRSRSAKMRIVERL